MLKLNAPRCLEELVARPTGDPGVELDALVDEWENHFFSLRCPCGGIEFTVRSFFYRRHYPSEELDEDLAYGPITLHCCTCNRELKCFDPALHGYDVETDRFPEPGPYPGTLRDYECSECAHKAFALTARFQYPDNVTDPVQKVGGHVPASEDLFTYFSLLGSCTACKTVATIASIGCA